MSMITCKWFGCRGIAAWPQAFVEPEMLVLPMSRSNFDWRGGVEPFEGEGFQFLRSLLISMDEVFQVSFYAESLGLRL